RTVTVHSWASIELRVCRLFVPRRAPGTLHGESPYALWGVHRARPIGGRPQNAVGISTKSGCGDSPIDSSGKPRRNVREGWTFRHHGDQFRTRPGMKFGVVKGPKSLAIHAFQKR